MRSSTERVHASSSAVRTVRYGTVYRSPLLQGGGLYIIYQASWLGLQLYRPVGGWFCAE